LSFSEKRSKNYINTALWKTFQICESKGPQRKDLYFRECAEVIFSEWQQQSHFEPLTVFPSFPVTKVAQVGGDRSRFRVQFSPAMKLFQNGQKNTT
jgi:hypothetical protein